MPAQPAQELPWGIERVNGGRSGNFKTAWVLDTGVDFYHPDLNVVVERSISFVGEGAWDENGHGTHVAGTIAAIDNDIGVIGVAPGAPVVAVKVLDANGNGTLSGVLAGVDHVARFGDAGDVANMSLAGGASPTLDDAVTNAASKGIRFVLAAGNDAQYAGNVSPARANGPNVYTVSAFASRTTVTRRSTLPSRDWASTRPGSAGITTACPALRWQRRTSPASCCRAMRAMAVRSSMIRTAVRTRLAWFPKPS